MLANLPCSICIYCFGLLATGRVTLTLFLPGGNFPVRQAAPETVFGFFVFPEDWSDSIQFNSIQFRYIWRTFSVSGTEGAQHITSIIPLFSKHFFSTSHIHPCRPLPLLHSYAEFTVQALWASLQEFWLLHCRGASALAHSRCSINACGLSEWTTLLLVPLVLPERVRSHWQKDLRVRQELRLISGADEHL